MPVTAWLAYAPYVFGYKEEAFPLLYTTKHLDQPYDSRQIIYLRKSEVYVKEKKKQFLMSLKICRSLAYTVCHAPTQMTS